MAIDSERKRKSIAAISLYALGPTAVADGSFNQADRQTIGYGYYGILAGAGNGDPPAAPLQQGAFMLTPSFGLGTASGLSNIII